MPELRRQGSLLPADKKIDAVSRARRIRVPKVTSARPSLSQRLSECVWGFQLSLERISKPLLHDMRKPEA
jgi:hypothetical protein